MISLCVMKKLTIPLVTVSQISTVQCYAIASNFFNGNWEFFVRTLDYFWLIISVPKDYFIKMTQPDDFIAIPENEPGQSISTKQPLEKKVGNANQSGMKYFP